jgi:hypothetical protein
MIVAAGLAAALLAPAAARAELPLGPHGLPETRTRERLAPGVTYTKIVRGRASKRDRWSADVAVVAARSGAADLAQRLREAGFDAAITRLPRAPDDRRHGALGYDVRSGRFGTRPPADQRVAAIEAAGFPARGSVSTAEDGGTGTGPWVVHVLRIDRRRYQGRVRAVLSNDAVAGRETVSALAARHGALAAINGGYFVIGASDGTPGDLAGSSIIGGTLVSEAVDGRTDLLLQRRGTRVARVSDAQTAIASDGARRVLDGDDRGPGLIRACGGTGGDRPTERPLHDVTCTDASELIRLEPVFGAVTETGPGTEAVLDATGTVTGLREPRGGPIPPGGSVLAGTGDGADWLRAHARPGNRVRVETGVRTGSGPLALRRGLDVVNGGPRLLRAGRPAISAEREGFDHPGDPSFYYAFGLRRNPRTMAGVTRDGRLLLVAADGHAPGYSAGLDFAEEAGVMRALGARGAVNLDGGGSTTMTIRGQLVTRPSDATGERPIGDAILLGGR